MRAIAMIILSTQLELGAKNYRIFDHFERFGAMRASHSYAVVKIVCSLYTSAIVNVK